MTNPTMTCTDIQLLIPDLLDGTLSDQQRAQFEAHAAQCAECGALVRDLVKLRDDAAALPTFSPSHDLWGGIESRLDSPVISMEGRRSAGRRWSTRQLAAAAAVLMAVTAGGTWMAATRTTAAPAAPVAANATPTDASGRTQLVEVADQKGIATYEGEIAKLRNILDTRRNELDSTTVAVLEKSMTVIDKAIAESKAALAADPASAFLAGRLNHAYDTKLELLRAAATLPSRS